MVLLVSKAVAVSALPVRAPANPVAAKTPLLELKVRLVPDLGGRFPVAPVVNKTLHEVSLDSSLTFTLLVVAARVAVAAVPEVFWFPAALTPGKSMLAVPLKETPPMVLLVSKAVAVSALPVRAPANPVAAKTPVLLRDIFSPAISEEPSLKLSLVALLEALKSFSAIASIPAQTRTESNTDDSPLAWKLSAPITSFSSIADS